MKVMWRPRFVNSSVGGLVIYKVSYRRVLWWHVGFGSTYIQCKCGTKHLTLRNSGGTNEVRTLISIGVWSISYHRSYVYPFAKLTLWDRAVARRKEQEKLS